MGNLKVSRGHYEVTIQDIESIGGGGSYRDRIDAWMEISENTLAYPIIDKISGNVPFKITGYCLPNDPSLGSTINCKVEAPNQISSTPNATIRICFYNRTSIDGNDIALGLRYKIVNEDQTFTGSGWTNLGYQYITTKTNVRTKHIVYFNLPNPSIGSTIVYQIYRNAGVEEDTHEGDIVVYLTQLELNRTGEITP